MAPTKSGPFRAEGGCTGSSSRETQPSARGGRGWFGSPCLVSGLIIPFLVPAAGMPPNESQDPRSSDVPPSKSRSGGHLARVLPWHWNLRGSPWLSTHLPCSSGPPCLLRPFSVLGGTPKPAPLLLSGTVYTGPPRASAGTSPGSSSPSHSLNWCFLRSLPKRHLLHPSSGSALRDRAETASPGQRPLCPWPATRAHHRTRQPTGRFLQGARLTGVIYDRCGWGQRPTCGRARVTSSL